MEDWRSFADVFDDILLVIELGIVAGLLLSFFNQLIDLVMFAVDWESSLVIEHPVVSGFGCSILIGMFPS